MSNVIQGHFKQVERDYGHKKISQRGVETLQSLQNFLLNQHSVMPIDMPMVLNMLNQVLSEEIVHKHFMNKGN